MLYKLSPAAATLFSSFNVGLTPGAFINFDPHAVRVLFDIVAPDGQSLLYRSCYEDIFQIVKETVWQVDITGTPGIGKSTMLIFFLLLFLQKGKTVVLITRKIAPGYLIFRPEDTTCSVHFTPNRPEDESLMFLLDVPNPSERGAHYPGLAIWVHSPGARDKGKEYIKRALLKLYLPLWSNEEVTAVWNTVAGKDLPIRPANKDDLIDNQAMWGNVPRAIFIPRQASLGRMDEHISMLRALGPERRLQTIANVGGTGSAPGLIDSLLLIEVVTSGERKYQRMQRQCTPYVYKQVLDMYTRDHRAVGDELAAQFSRIPELGGPYGTLFELHAHDHIALGGSESYTLIPIHKEPFVDNTQVHAVTIEFTRRATFRQLRTLMPGPEEQLNIEENVYYQPTIKNLAAGDSFAVTRDGDHYTLWIWQYTVSASHDIVARGVTEILETLGSVKSATAAVKFVFCVPEHVLNDFTMGQLKTKADMEMQNIPAAMKRTELYKMQLPYPCPAYEEQLEPAIAAGVTGGKASEDPAV